MNKPQDVEVLYEQEPYVVYQAEIEVEYAGGNYEYGYMVLNTDTGIVEFMSPCLPDCMSVASNSSAGLNFFTQGAQQAIDVEILTDEE